MLVNAASNSLKLLGFFVTLFDWLKLDDQRIFNGLNLSITFFDKHLDNFSLKFFLISCFMHLLGLGSL